MADVVTGNTQLAATKAEIIANVIQKELSFTAKLKQYSKDYSVFARKGASSVSIPKAGSFTVQNRATATAGEIQALTFAKDTIPLDQRAYVSWLVDSNDEIESSLEVKMVYAQRAASAHGRAWDANHNTVALASAFDTAAAAGNVTLAKFLTMRTELIKNDANPAQLVFVGSPDQYAALLGDEDVKKFINYGTNQAISTGVVPTLYGVHVVEHNGLTSGQYYMYDVDAMAYAIQMDANIASQPEIAYGTSAVREAMDMKYGHEALFQGQKGVSSTVSALIVKFKAPAPTP